MKYVLLMGRGIEGTGNTKYAVELQQYLHACGDECITIANNDKKWGREKSHANDIKQMSFDVESEKIIDLCKNADIVIVLSTPAKNYPEFSKLGFYDVVKASFDAGKKVIYIQVDHLSQSINRNFYSEWEYLDIFDYFTKVFVHSRSGDFVKFCKRNGVPTDNFIYGDDGNFVGINGLDWDKYKEFHKPFCEKDKKTIKFIGRSAVWKGPWLVRDIHGKYLKDEGYITTLEGIEGSIQTVSELYKQTKPERIPRDDVCVNLDMSTKKMLNDGSFNLERRMPVYVFPPYDNKNALERMSRCQFGIELLLLSDGVLANIMEYAMMEIVAVGTVPVFRKRWGEMFKVDGKPIIEYPCGTIFIDENNPEEGIKIMNEVSENEDTYNQMRNNAFKFYSEYFNSKRNFGELVRLINEI